jgi:hypothetical protein
MPISYKEFVKALEIVRKYQEQIKKHHIEVTEKLDSISVYATVSRDTDIKNSKLSKRTLRVMHENDIVDIYKGKVGDLEPLSLKEIGRFRGLGIRGMNELKELCLYTGVAIKP